MAVLDSVFRVYELSIILVSGLAAVALALDYLKKMEIERGEYYVLLMISVSGMMLMTQAHDLIYGFPGGIGNALHAPLRAGGF